MFLHIGKDKMIKSKDIIIILDYEKTIKSLLFQQYLSRAQSAGLVDEDEEEERQVKKSIIITDKKLYYSSIAAPTLLKRTLT